MSIRESAGAHLGTSRALETCLHLATLGSSSGVPARRQTPQSPSIHLKMTVLLMVRLGEFVDSLWRALII